MAISTRANRGCGIPRTPWPHPLVHTIARVIGPVREQACEDLCVHALGGAGGYSASLLTVAAGLAPRPEASLGLAMARPSKLASRLAWIARTTGSPRCLLRWPARLALIAGVAVLAGALGSVELARASAKVPPLAGAKPEAQAQAEGDGPEVVIVTVKAKDTGRPLAGARIHATLDHQDLDLVTDDAGNARVDRTGRAFNDSSSLDVWDSGHVQQRPFFARRGRLPRIPAELTVELHPGEETLGGKVVDADGWPVAGVVVKVWGYPGSMKEKNELAYMVDARTDAAGVGLVGARRARPTLRVYWAGKGPWILARGRAKGGSGPLRNKDDIREGSPKAPRDRINFCPRGLDDV